MPWEFGNSQFLLIGAAAPEGTACPALDPNASIQIGDDLIHVYQGRIDALINQLGTDVVLEFDPANSSCTNCFLDGISGRSTGKYRPGGPLPFGGGKRCPVCKGEGFIKVAETRCIKALVQWSPKDMRDFGVMVNDPFSVARTKCGLAEVGYIARCRTAIIDYQISDILLNRVRRIRGPIPVGLREDRYAITFWQLVGA